MVSRNLEQKPYTVRAVSGLSKFRYGVGVRATQSKQKTLRGGSDSCKVFDESS